MARLRPVKVTHTLTFEETTQFAHFFNLLVEVDVRLSKTTKSKAKTKKEKCEVPKRKHRSIKQKPCCIKCPAICNASSPVMRDLYLNSFIRIFNGVQINPMGYNNDRHHSFIAYF